MPFCDKFENTNLKNVMKKLVIETQNMAKFQDMQRQKLLINISVAFWLMERAEEQVSLVWWQSFLLS